MCVKFGLMPLQTTTLLYCSYHLRFGLVNLTVLFSMFQVFISMYTCRKLPTWRHYSSVCFQLIQMYFVCVSMERLYWNLNRLLIICFVRFFFSLHKTNVNIISMSLNERSFLLVSIQGYWHSKWQQQISFMTIV